MITLPKPTKSGVAKSSSMIVPCMVNSWLYSSLDMICMPGKNSSARISTARIPPKTKKTKAVMMYMYPMTLWSVEVSQLTMIDPLRVFAEDSSAAVLAGATARASVRKMGACESEKRGFSFLRAIREGNFPGLGNAT